MKNYNNIERHWSIDEQQTLTTSINNKQQIKKKQKNKKRKQYTTKVQLRINIARFLSLILTLYINKTLTKQQRLSKTIVKQFNLKQTT